MTYSLPFLRTKEQLSQNLLTDDLTFMPRCCGSASLVSGEAVVREEETRLVKAGLRCDEDDEQSRNCCWTGENAATGLIKVLNADLNNIMRCTKRFEQEMTIIRREPFRFTKIGTRPSTFSRGKNFGPQQASCLHAARVFSTSPLP